MTGSLRPEALAELLPSLANDVNTPAQYVGDNVSFLRRAFDKLLPLVEAYEARANAADAGEDPEALQQALEHARANAKLPSLQRQVPRAVEQALHGLGQINASMRALKELARPGHVAPEATDLHELVEAAATLTRGEWAYVADLKLAFDWSLPAVSVLRQELSRVLSDALLLASRSIAASLPPGSADKGTLLVTTRRVDARAELELQGGGATLRLSLPLLEPES